jgi:deoxyribodipyrimidine photo-lyase
VDLNPIEQQFYNWRNREDYPEPIVNIEETNTNDIVWSFRKKDEVKEEGSILKKHVSNPNRRAKKTKS